jgi:MFS family permease
MTAAWLALAVTTGIQALGAAAVLALPVMAPAVAQSLGISAAYTGLYVSLVYVGAIVASLAAGTVVARFGAIRVSQGGLIACAAGLCLSMVPWLPAIAAGAILIGLGYGPITPASSHLLARTTPRERMSLVFSIKQTGVPLGGVLAGAIVPSLLLWVGWQAALLAVAAANVLCALLAQPLRAELDADRDASKRLVFGSLAGPLRIVMSNPGLRALAACSFFFSITQHSLTSYLVTYLHATLAYGLVTAGLALSAAQAGGVAGRIAWGYVADRWLGAGRMLACLALLMSAAAFATALLHPGLPVVLVTAVLMVFGASAVGWNGVYLAEVARRAPGDQVSLATGGTLAVTFFGVVLGPPAFGGLSALFGTYRAGFLGLAVACGLCTLALARAQRRASPARAT